MRGDLFGSIKEQAHPKKADGNPESWAGDKYQQRPEIIGLLHLGNGVSAVSLKKPIDSRLAAIYQPVLDD